MSNSTSSSPDDFYNDGVGVLIRKPGTYLALYTVQVPSGTPLTTTFALQMNNQNIPGMVVGVDHKSSSGSTVYSAQGILNAPENATLRLSSSAIINYTGAANLTLASLNLIQLSGEDSTTETDG